MRFCVLLNFKISARIFYNIILFLRLLDSSVKSVFYGFKIEMWAIRNIGHLLSQFAAVNAIWKKNSLLAIITVTANVF